MKRFIVVGALGAALLMLGQASLTLGLHPDHLYSIGSLARGCAALVVGSALFVSGMLGLADGYERATGSLRALLPRKQPPAQGLEVTGLAELDESQRGFWRAYQRAAVGICVFLAGLLAVTATLAHSSLALYTLVVGVSIVGLAGATALLSLGGLRRMRRSHVAVSHSASLLENQPDRQVERPPVKKRPFPAYSLFNRRGGYGRDMERRRTRPGPAR